jgi:hypothetical protein
MGALGLVREDAGGCHADNTLDMQRAGGIEHVGIDDEIVVGHVELSRHIFKETPDLGSEVDDVRGAKRGENCEAFVIPVDHGVKMHTENCLKLRKRFACHTS